MQDVLIGEIQARLMACLNALAAGKDISPSQRYRLEGLCEAACLLGKKEAVRKVVDEVYRQHGEGMNDVGNLSDELLRNLPLWMHRAPVYPSTKD